MNHSKMSDNASDPDDMTSSESNTSSVNGSDGILITSGDIFDKVHVKMMLVNIYPLIFVMVYAILGVIGNSIVMYVYWTKWKRNKTRIFILCLGFLDLINCVFNMPVEVVVLWQPLTFDFHYLCKISRGVTFVINNTGSLVFVSIAIERYMLVYHPLKYRRMTPKFAKIMCLLAFISSCSVSWPSFIFYGTYTYKLPIPQLDNVYVVGNTCLISNEYILKQQLTLIFTTILFGLMIFVFIVLTALYIAIGRKIYLATCTDTIENEKEDATKLFGRSILSALTGGGVMKCDKMNYKRQSSRYSTAISGDFTSTLDTSEIPASYPNIPAETGSEKMRLSYPPINVERKQSTVRTIDSRQNNRMSRKFSTIKGKPTRKNTVMMRVVTIAFMLSFTPFLCILIIRYTNSSYYQSLGDSGKIAYSVFLRTYFINSMVNPFIYGFMNMKFRQHVKALLINVFCFCRKNKSK